MKIKKIRHICIIAKDINVMTRFYQDILNFKLKSNQIYQSKEISRGVGLQDVELETSLLTLEDNLEIELTQYKNHDHSAGSYHVYDRGYRHIAFIVENILESYKEVLAADLECLSEPVHIKRTDGKELMFFYFKDPEGNILELNEFL